MPRTRRLVNGEEKTAYHIMSRTALNGFPFGDVEKDELVKIIKKFSKLFFVEVFGFCIMGNHFHLLIQMFPEHYFEEEEIRRRCKAHYGEDFEVSDDMIAGYRVKLSSLSNYMKEIKQAFSWYYNQRHHRRGTLWGERFKSVIVENGETLINCLAYIDLNPLPGPILHLGNICLIPEVYVNRLFGYQVFLKALFPFCYNLLIREIFPVQIQQEYQCHCSSGNHHVTRIRKMTALLYDLFYKIRRFCDLASLFLFSSFRAAFAANASEIGIVVYSKHF